MITQSKQLIIETIKKFLDNIESSSNMQDRFTITDEMFTYLYLNYQFLEETPRFKECVYNRLIRFETENLPETMKNRLKYHKSMLFPEPEIHKTFSEPEQY